MSITQELESIRQELDRQRAALCERIERDDKLLTAPIGTNPDPADRARQYTFKERRSAVLAHLRQQLAQTETALQRIDDGSYGTCADCGAKIDPARLKALPHALLCIDCQERQEKPA